MNVALWITQGLLAAVFLMTGMMKLVKGKGRLKTDPRMLWVNDVPESRVRLAGVTAMLGAIGPILPWTPDIVPVLTPLAAIGLVAQMALAMPLHMKRKETQTVVVNAIFRPSHCVLPSDVFPIWGRSRLRRLANSPDPYPLIDRVIALSGVLILSNYFT